MVSTTGGDLSPSIRYRVMISEKLNNAMEEELVKEYRRGLEDGLAVADRICGWLTKQPEPKWARTVRKMGLKIINEKRCGEE